MVQKPDAEGGQYNTEEVEQLIQDSRLFIRYGDYDLAIATLSNVLNSKSSLTQKAAVHKLLCQCYRKTEQYNLALVHINKAISINSKGKLDRRAREEHAICLMNKGIVLEVQGKYTDAIASYQSAISNFLDMFENSQESYGIIINAYLTLGSCYEKKGSLELALDTYKKCLNYFCEDKENDRRYCALMNSIHNLENNVKNTVIL